ncbi:ARM repeat superfamily protein [Striga asiatica]|uniref:ARM repeat superfamily protein n=1 Tax=Striga asiatica TaxID=4170 RepID=A0A5A7PVX6_STRAF|nr:ARM repeat superfamily protein [Striga asiatica]
MLFQSLGSHGQKFSKSMWEDCLGNYIFPSLDHASHLAATSSKDEWQGKELGTRKGKAVHMLIHHSRNTAQKQWDETLALVLGGIARIFRSFFPFLRSLRNFESGWESLLVFIKNSILNGSKEIALAAINCLQSTIVSHSPKGNLPLTYIRSVLDIYEDVLLKSPNNTYHVSEKVQQEILHGLGELYFQAQGMFDNDMYKQLIFVIDSTIKESKISNNNFEADYGHVPPVQRTVLEILPSLRPAANLSSMWILLLMKLLHYLPAVDPLLDENKDRYEPVGNGSHFFSGDMTNGSSSMTQKEGEGFTLNNKYTLFAEKLVPVLVDLFLLAPVKEKYDVFPNLIQSLGRCMTTRRDDPDGTLWRIAVEGFHRLLITDVKKLKPESCIDNSITRQQRVHVWKEVADVYELFLVGHCGRALPSNKVSEIDESLEMNILDILGDNILGSDTDIPLDILQRLISTLDRCASRTCSLPLETVELMPSHCSRFSLTCLKKLFSLSSLETSDWSLGRSEVSKIAVVTLTSRCDFILRKFLSDENGIGDERSLPRARMEEVIFVLKELAQLVILPETGMSLPLPPQLKEVLSKDNERRHPHLLVLFPAFCELVLSRELHVRELVQICLRLTAEDLGLQKLDVNS